MNDMEATCLLILDGRRGALCAASAVQSLFHGFGTVGVKVFMLLICPKPTPP
jgi:hypothetical protein